MRTQKSVRNVTVAVFFQVLGILISFFARQVFITNLGENYLGLEGLYSNILQMLSLAELGFSTAILFRLYQPIADRDIPKIRMLMGYFRGIYIKVGSLILILGLTLVPFLDLLMKEDVAITNAKLYYVLYLLATVSVYFFAYKSTFILANQDKYITTIIRYSIFITMTGIQMIVLIVFKNYLYYLVLLLIFNISEGLIINYVANRQYPYIKNIGKKEINAEEKGIIRKNVSALLVHNIGGVVINSTDNIVISAYIGLATVGLYSNYFLIFNAINIILGQVFKSITASVGDLSTENDKERLHEVYRIGMYINAFLFTVCAVMIWISGDDFIAIWLGDNFIIGRNVFIVLIIVFFINGMRRITLVYRDSLGLYWYDRHKPLIEGALNLVISIALVNRIGLMGVFLGTLFSMLLTSFWVEPYIVYKYAFQKSIMDYIKRYVLYLFVAAIVFSGVTLFNQHFFELVIFPSNIIGLVLKQFFIGGVAVLIFIGITFRTDEFIRTKNIVMNILRK